MKIKTFTLLLCSLFVTAVTAQERPTYSVPRVDIGPKIDGEIDEMWEALPANLIDKAFQSEIPTVSDPDPSYWKMVWVDPLGVYVLVQVNDDDYFPSYETGGASYLYDKPEIYFDCNYVLQDDGGASGEGQPGNGHHQCAPPPGDGLDNGTELDAGEDGEADADDLGVKYAFLLEDPQYTVEYFFPMEYFTDKDGIINDFSGEVGFDVTICERDHGDRDTDSPRMRAVWANTGVGGDANESWNSMDDCGIITFEGVGEKVYVTSIDLSAASEITQNNKTMQIEATVLPEDATNKKLAWSVEEKGGKASVDKYGVVTPIADGLVTITATAQDGSYLEKSVDVNISGQIVSLSELNLIRNGYFNDVDEDGIALSWNPGFEVQNGAMYFPAADGELENPWDGSRRSGETGFGCNSTDTYYFSFVMWSEVTDSFYVDFEDPADPDYLRYGTTSSQWSTGTSEWWILTQQEPFKYEITDLVFTNMKENTIENMNFMGGLHNNGGVWVDSVILVNMNDMSLVADPYKEVESITVSGAEGATVVAIGSTLQMSAVVLPEDADYGDVVYWSVVPGTGWATIDDNGVLTADSVGSVTVVATASDDSGIKGSKQINVSWPEGIERNVVNTLKVYPNPAVNELNVVVSQPGVTVSIYNSVGMRMDEVVVTETEHLFNISNYASGIYFVKTGNLVAKFVK